MSAKSDEFKVQLLETFASLITAAFGLVAALAWKTRSRPPSRRCSEPRTIS